MSVTARFKVVLGVLLEEQEAEVFMKSLTDEQQDYMNECEFVHTVSPMSGYSFIFGESLYNMSEDSNGELKSFDLSDDMYDYYFKKLVVFVRNLEVEKSDLYNKLKVRLDGSATLLHAYVEYR